MTFHRKFNPADPLSHSTKVSDPNLDHITRDLYSMIYEPSDDSFLFMEAMELDLNTLRLILPLNLVIMEMGVGTGILSSYMSRLLAASTPILMDNDRKNNDDLDALFNPTTIGMDINPLAVKMTNMTYSNNSIINAHCIESNLLSNLSKDYNHTCNVFLFNPPYVPTFDHEVGNTIQDDMITNAYAGGEKGRDILDLLIPQIPTIMPLDAPFVFYCVYLHPHNDINELNGLLNNSLKENDKNEKSVKMLNTKFISHIIKARQCGLESLAIVRYMTTSIFEKLPIELQNVFPIANDENMKAIFKPKFSPPTITSEDITRKMAENPLTKLLFGKETDSEEDEDDEGNMFRTF